MIVYLHNVYIKLFELSELPSINVFFYSLVNDLIMDKYIGKNFEAPKNDNKNAL